MIKTMTEIFPFILSSILVIFCTQLLFNANREWQWSQSSAGTTKVAEELRIKPKTNCPKQFCLKKNNNHTITCVPLTWQNIFCCQPMTHSWTSDEVSFFPLPSVLSSMPPSVVDKAVGLSSGNDADTFFSDTLDEVEIHICKDISVMFIRN